MNILVIGNGFDLAHGLPTRYSDFLERLLRIKQGDSFPKDDLNSCYYEELLDLINNNVLIDYYLSVYEKLCKTGHDKWVDFEQEMSMLVKNLYKLRHFYTDRNQQHQDVLLIRNALDFFINKACKKNTLTDIQSIESLSGLLYDSLNRLIRALEIYLTLIIPNKEIKPIKQIKDLEVNCLLSFNYTDTFNCLYSHNGVESCFIHGKAFLDDTVSNCNLVLGIDEFLPEGVKDTDNEFLLFKKFYQRIYKQTDSNYLDWLEEFKPITYNTNDLFIYGHSLDITDRDVLSKLILAENVNTHVFYNDKKSLSSQISNLIKVIGQENLVRMAGGQNRSIEFIQTTM